MGSYVELILYKTYADLRAESERTYLGFLWWVFEPIMFMLVFYFVFGNLRGGGRPDNYVAFLLIGLTTWQWFKACMTHGATTILQGRGLMKQVHLPKVVFPIVLILTDSVKFVFILVLLLIFLWLSGFLPTSAYLWLPVILLVQLLLITALVFFLAAIIPFIPDLQFVVENILLAAFFLSGVFFKAEMISEQYRFYFYLNPMTNLIEAYRDVLMYGRGPDISALLVVGLVSALGIWLGARLIARFEYVYPKVTM